MYSTKPAPAPTPFPLQTMYVPVLQYYSLPLQRLVRTPPTKKHRKICIFDWDDTLCPTTAWMSANSKVSAEALREFGCAVYILLNKYIRVFGEENLFIVTNATKHWVLHSLAALSKSYQSKMVSGSEQQRQTDYFAAIYNSLVSMNILICSAQDLHAERFPQHMTIWKTRVFKHIIKRHFNLLSGSQDTIYSIVSIGDSEAEFVASSEASAMLKTYNLMNRSNNEVRLHRMKLAEAPSAKVMMEQFAMLMEEVDKW